MSDDDSSTDWKPATIAEVKQILKEDLATCDAEQKGIFDRYSVEPYAAPIVRYGQPERPIFFRSVLQSPPFRAHSFPRPGTRANMWKPAIVITTAFALVAGVGAARLYFDALAKPHRATDNDSPFFLVYQPGKVITRFYLPNQPCTGAYSKSGGDEGPRDVNFETTCVIPSNLEEQFVGAIHDELLHTLNASHATVRKEEDHAVYGYRCSYRSGRSRGTVEIEPLERLIAQGEGAPPQGLERVRVRLRVNEEP